MNRRQDVAPPAPAHPSGGPAGTAQYRNPARLDARIRLHRDFATSSVPWYAWVFDRIVARTPEVAAVLEVGAGTGALWTHNYDRLPPAWWVWLTDVESNMVRGLRHALDGAPQVTVAEADAADLPLGPGSFDTLVANHMLYHLPDPSAALGELARVLRPGGTLLAATNGPSHLTELYALVEARLPEPADDVRAPRAEFGLDDGGALVGRHFSDVRLERYDDALGVTDAGPLLDYVRSLPLDALTEHHIADIGDEVRAVIARDGAVAVTKDVGLFTAVAG